MRQPKQGQISKSNKGYFKCKRNSDNVVHEKTENLMHYKINLGNEYLKTTAKPTQLCFDKGISDSSPYNNCTTSLFDRLREEHNSSGRVNRSSQFHPHNARKSTGRPNSYFNTCAEKVEINTIINQKVKRGNYSNKKQKFASSNCSTTSCGVKSKYTDANKANKGTPKQVEIVRNFGMRKNTDPSRIIAQKSFLYENSKLLRLDG